MVRNKNNGGISGSAEAGDTLNLLDSTESETEWLNLPPLKGKKPKKKKNSKVHKNSDSSSGSLWTFMKVFLALVVIVAVVLLSVVSAWLVTQLDDVRESLEALEVRSSKSSEDVDKLSPDLQTLNATLHRLIADLSKVNSTVTQMSGTVGELTKSVHAAPELKELPEKLQSVSKVLADLGSDVSGIKDVFMKTTTQSIDDLNTKFTELETRVDKQSSEAADQKGATPDLENVVQVMSQQFQDLNSTVSTQISVLMKASSKHEEKLIALDNSYNIIQSNLSSLAKMMSSTNTAVSNTTSTDGTTNDVTPSDSTDYSSDQFRQSVTSIVKDVLSSESQVGKVEEVMSNITKALASIDQLKYKLEESDHPDKSGTGEATPGNFITEEQFKAFEDEVDDDIYNLNSSFVRLKEDVTTMSLILGSHSNSINNLTYHLEATKSYMKTYLKQMIEESNSDKVTTASTVKSEPANQTPSSNSVTEKPGVTLVPSTAASSKQATTVGRTKVTPTGSE